MLLRDSDSIEHDLLMVSKNFYPHFQITNDRVKPVDAKRVKNPEGKVEKTSPGKVRNYLTDFFCSIARRASIFSRSSSSLCKR